MGLYEHWPYVNFHDLNLDWIVTTIKQLQTEVNSIEEWHDDWQQRLEELDQEYTRIIRMYDTLENDFKQFKTDVNTDFRELQENLLQQIHEAEEALILDVNAFKADVRFSLDGFQTEITDMNIRLDNAIEHLSDNLTILNPFTGLNQPISEVIGMLAGFHMQNSITAGEYDALNLTASAYDTKNLTAFQYDIEAKLYLL